MLLQAFLSFLLPPQKLHNIVKEIALAYAPHALVAVKGNAKDAKVVVKMDVNLLVEIAVVKDAKDVVTKCVKVTA